MTKIIGLTGGIGSGKTTIGYYMQSLGIPVYVADEEARKLTDSPQIATAIQNAFGKETVKNGKVDRKKLAKIVFKNAERLSQLNAIIHPAVYLHFHHWLEQHKQAALVVKEAAILFESGSYKDCDFIITVTAPLESRIARVMKRDNISRDLVLERINHQMPEHQRIERSDFIIENTDLENAKSATVEILKKLTNI